MPTGQIKCLNDVKKSRPVGHKKPIIEQRGKKDCIVCEQMDQNLRVVGALCKLKAADKWWSLSLTVINATEMTACYIWQSFPRD